MGTSNNSQFVSPARAGVQSCRDLMDSCFSENDIFRGSLICYTYKCQGVCSCILLLIVLLIHNQLLSTSYRSSKWYDYSSHSLRVVQGDRPMGRCVLNSTSIQGDVLFSSVQANPDRDVRGWPQVLINDRKSYRGFFGIGRMYLAEN